MKIPISSRKVTQVLGLVVLCLTLASLAGQYYKHFVGDNPFWLKVVDRLDVNFEYNIPTWYQTTSLFACFLLLAAVATVKRAEANRYARHWAFAALLFLYFSADEFLAIHEYMNELRSVIPARGLFFNTWVIPAGIFVLIFSVAYARFLLHLPPRLRGLFMIGGALYVSGALGVEMVSAYYIDSTDKPDGFTYAVLATIEELLEMSGIVVFINALLSYVALPDETCEIAAWSGNLLPTDMDQPSQLDMYRHNPR